MSLTITDGAGVDKTLKTTADGVDLIPHKIAEGIAVTAATYAPAATPANPIALAVDKTTGGLLCHTRRLDIFNDAIVAVGDVEHDAPDSDTGVLRIGGKASNPVVEQPLVAIGDRVGVAIDTSGRLRVVNCANDQMNQYGLLARTATPTVAASVTQLSSRGIIVQIGITALTGAAAITVTLEASSYYAPSLFLTILERVVNVTGLHQMKVYPGLPEVAGESKNDVLPRIFRVRITHANADSITYVVSTSLLA